MAAATLDLKDMNPPVAAGAGGRVPVLSPYGSPQEMTEMRIAIHTRLLDMIHPDQVGAMAGDRAKAEVRASISRAIDDLHLPLNGHKEAVTDQVLAEVYGLGPIEPLLDDPTISDILVTTPKMVHIERAGQLIETAVQFRDDAHLTRIIEKIVSRVGRRIDQSSPLVDARLPDGSRVNAVIPPVAVDGPLLSIRRFGGIPLPAETLVKNLSLTEGMLELLRACVKARLNIVVSGGTGAGKTTLLNILSGAIPDNERIVSIEDAAELQLRQRHVARMESRPSNIDGEGAVKIRQLVINALRMRPDRIIVGEVRGEEALDMLQAMNTGHDGSLTTVHANSPRDALSRIETMVGMANAGIPMRAVRQQMSSAIDLFVQIGRMTDGARRVTHITECCGMEGEQITVQDLFVFEKTGLGDDGRVKGRFRATGIRPKFSERLIAAGIQLPSSLFQVVVELR
ncbi:MAG: CpaF family protein [Bryobacteraceae bacterium]